MVVNFPNLLTLTRVLLIPIVLFLWVNDNIILSSICFVLLISTDYFDGFIARKFNQCTDFGAIFDPIADKIVALSFYPFLLSQGLIPIWFSIIVILRNFSQIMSIPILIWWLKREFKVKPKKFAKYGTAISDIFIAIPLFVPLQYSENYILVLMLAVCIFEIPILVTYIPRLIQIAIGKHDTFE